MTTDSTASDETITAPVRVPNVSAGARSGLDHEVIGANAHEAYAINQELEQQTADPDAIVVPAGDLESRLEWVAAGETVDERTDRATALYEHELDTDENADADALGAAMRTAVYGEQTQSTPTEPSDPTNGALPTGELVQSDTAGTGDSINAETGVVTPGGQRLPAIEQNDGEPLDVAIPDDVPDTVEALLAWVHEPEAHDEQHDRAAAVLNRETGDDGKQRVTLVEPLTAEYPPPPAD